MGFAHGVQFPSLPLTSSPYLPTGDLAVHPWVELRRSARVIDRLLISPLPAISPPSRLIEP
jgi:hypothetical protein